MGLVIVLGPCKSHKLSWDVWDSHRVVHITLYLMSCTFDTIKGNKIKFFFLFHRMPLGKLRSSLSLALFWRQQ